MKKFLLIFSLFSWTFPSFLLAQIQFFHVDSVSSFRGLFVQKEKVWVSGYPSSIYSIDAEAQKQIFSSKNNTFSSNNLDFRGIQVFGNDTIVVFSSGTPALVLQSINGGKSWKQVFFEADSSYFLDAMTWKNEKEGWILADPILGKFLLLHTNDGGKTWVKEKGPESRPQEAAYAASNSSLVYDSENLYFATGGSQSVIWKFSQNKWDPINTPAKIGEGSGIFSLAVKGKKMWIVGGNWKKSNDPEGAIFYSKNGGKTWKSPKSVVGGYRSCVDVGFGLCATTGTNGSEMSTNQGKTWQKFNVGFNVLKISDNKIWFAGNKGKIGFLDLSRNISK